MNKEKFLKWSFYFVIILIAACLLLIGINDLAIRIRPGKTAAEEESDIIAASKQDERMKSIFSVIPVKTNKVQGGLPYEKYDMSPETNPEGSTSMLMKMKGDFKGVGEKPKNPMQILNDMAAPEKPFVSFSKSDYDGKIMISSESAQPKLDRSEGVPEPGLPLERSRITKISAPLDYKIYRDAKVWKAFADANGIKTDNDFNKNALIVLISMSDFPNGIFSIKEIKKEDGGLTVYYSVNPLLMSAGIEENLRNQYAVSAIPKDTKTVTLKQI